MLSFVSGLCCMGTALPSFSQFANRKNKGKFEVAINSGLTYFLGDVGGKPGIGEKFIKDLNWKQFDPLVGIQANYYVENWLNIKGAFNYTSIHAADSLISKEGGEERWRIYRNLSFSSKVWEVYGAAQVNPLLFFKKKKSFSRFNTYLSLGIGAFHFNPKTEYEGKLVALKPLRLEGQGFPQYPDRKEYHLLQLYFPLSGGFKYYVTPHLYIGLEIMYRQTFTDYLDDVSKTYVETKYYDRYLPKNLVPLAKQLYNRSLRPNSGLPGVARGDEKDRDTFFSMMFQLGYRWDRSNNENDHTRTRRYKPIKVRRNRYLR